MSTDIGEVIGEIEAARKLMDRSDGAALIDLGATDDQQKHAKLADLMALTAGREARGGREKIFTLPDMYSHAASLDVGYDMDIGYIRSRVAFRIIEEMENLSIFWLVDFRSFSSKFRGNMNGDYLYAGLHNGLTVRSGSIFDSQTTRHKSWVPLWDSIRSDYLVQILENDAARTNFDMRRLHPTFNMNVWLDKEALVAGGAILGHYILCAPKLGGAPRYMEDVLKHTIRPFPVCWMNNQSVFVTKLRKKADRGLLTKAYKPRWIDAKTVYKELRRHQEKLCDCQTTEEDRPQEEKSGSQAKEDRFAQTRSSGRVVSCQRVFWSCVIFGFPEPLVIEPSFDEHDDLTFSLIARYDTDDLLYKAIDALSTGQTHVVPDEVDPESDVSLRSVTSSPRHATSGGAGWETPEHIFKHMGLEINWIPTTFTLRARSLS